MREKTKTAKVLYVDGIPFRLGDRRLTVTHASPITKIVLHLANARSDNERNKYRIKLSTGLAKQTVYNGIKSLKTMNFISEKISKERARTGLPIRNYYLTEEGWYEAALLDPRLVKKVEEKFGKPIESLYGDRAVTKNLYLDWLIKRVRAALSLGIAPPGWYFKLTTDEHGEVKFTHALDPSLLERIEQEEEIIQAYSASKPVRIKRKAGDPAPHRRSGKAS